MRSKSVTIRGAGAHDAKALDPCGHGRNARALRQVRFPRALRPALEEVGRLRDEGHPVADALTDRPPLRCVRMRWVLRANATEAVDGLLVARVAVPELIEARILEAQRS